MRDEFDKCQFCRHYEPFEGCVWDCNNYEEFKPAKDRLIEKAKEKHISVTDVIALINLDD